MRRARFAALGFFAAAGCLGLDEPGSDSFFRRPEPTGPLPALSPASTEAAARVDSIGRRILASNPQVGARPMFRTIGAPQPEVFHRGTSDVYITEGLVRQCASDGQLAAVLCTQLGKMVAEREALTPGSVRKPERLPPIDTRVGTDSGWGTPPDQTRLRELADVEPERRGRRTAVAPPDPQALARVYLLRTGYHDEDLQAAAPLLQAATSHSNFEKQFTAPAPAAPNEPAPLQ
jgi:hypothetical protein